MSELAALIVALSGFAAASGATIRLWLRLRAERQERLERRRRLDP
jgi:hypothetical protein